MATSSRARKCLYDLRELQRKLEEVLPYRAVPLLVVALPALARRVERGRRQQRLEHRAKRAFVDTCAQVLRVDDVIAHTAGTAVFTIALTCASRAARALAAADARSVAHRVGAMVAHRVGTPAETGWTILRTGAAAAVLQREIRSALERGARDRERYEFFATVGHELRTPLTSIRGYLDTLLEGGVEPATALRFLQIAQRETLRMTRLVDGMRELSLLELTSEIAFEPTCCVREAIELASQALAPVARERGIRMLRAQSQDTIVRMRSQVCVQLLINLIDNALKYGREGGTVSIGVRSERAMAVICVDDDGPGIPSDEAAAIFGARVRGIQGTQRPGAGIGLAVVKMIVDREEGDVRVLHSPLGGARFEVRLPLWAESASSAS